MSRKSNYKAFRELLATCTPPCLPYLGTFLTDLTFIEEGNPDTMSATSPHTLVLEEKKAADRLALCGGQAADYPPAGGAQLINFVKRRKVAEVILRLQDYQATPYNFEHVPAIQSFLERATVMDEDQLYAASLVCEPRAKKS